MMKKSVDNFEGIKRSESLKYFLEISGIFLSLYFLLNVFSLIQSDFWYDEIITFWDYGIHGKNALNILSNYPVANNHLYSSVLTHWYINFLIEIKSLSPFNIRLLPVFWSILTILMSFFFVKKIFSSTSAFFCSFIFLLSPVFLNFSYQLRGYSMTIFFVLLLACSLYQILGEKQRKQGYIFYSISAILLPGIIPSNILVFSVIIPVFLYEYFKKNSTLNVRRTDLFVIIFTPIFGLCIYLPILDQFLEVIKKTSGWDIGLLVFLNVFGAFIVHLFPLIIFFQKFDIRKKYKENSFSFTLLVLCVLNIFFICIVKSPAPFPRIFVQFLPLITLAIIDLSRKNLKIEYNNRFLFKIFVAILFARVFILSGDFYSEKKLSKGLYSQNLLAQYYRNNFYLSNFFLGEIPSLKKLSPKKILCESQHFPALKFYWLQYVSNVDITMNLKNLDLNLNNEGLYIFALNELIAQQMFSQIKGNEKFVLSKISGKKYFNLFKINKKK